jgi:hypothetical protein
MPQGGMAARGNGKSVLHLGGRKMRTILLALAALLALSAAAQGKFILALENHNPNNWVGTPGTFTIDVTLQSDGQPTSLGTTQYLGAQIVLSALPAGWTLSNVVYNTVDFDPGIQAGVDPAGPLGVFNDGITYPAYTAKKTLLSLTLFAPTRGVLNIYKGEGTYVGDSEYNGFYPGDDLVLINFPEPATALLLCAVAPLLLRRRTRVAK